MEDVVDLIKTDTDNTGSRPIGVKTIENPQRPLKEPCIVIDATDKDIVDGSIKIDTDHTNIRPPVVKSIVNPQRPQPQPRPRFDPCIATDGPNTTPDDIKKPKRRRCVIFNHFKFMVVLENGKTLEERKGTDKDAQAIATYFLEKDYDVSLHNDKTCGEMTEILQLHAAESNKWDRIVFFVLTHGSKDKLYAKDDSYKYDTLFTPFMSENCDGKDKLFFVNCCQGYEWDIGNEIFTDACDVPLHTPERDDFLVALSSIPGFVTMRHEEKGTFFIQLLIEVLRKNESQQDIVTILTNVNREITFDVSGNYGKMSEYKGTAVQRETRKQIPICFSTCRKLIYL